MAVEPAEKAKALLRWIAVGVACGLASAAFLHLLELATHVREAHEWLVYLLPFAGVLVGLVYERWGAPIKGGSNLIIDTIHDDREQIPLRMAPMVLVGTVLTHLFGGSAGREGTAVQMGASIADAIAHRPRGSREARRGLLAAGIAGGFSSVFGTPLAGTIFALEVHSIGHLEYESFVPALVAALVGDVVTRHLGVVHTPYPTVGAVDLGPLVLVKLAVLGVAMALATRAFVELTHRLKGALAKMRLPIRMAIGGVAVVALWKVVGTSDYLGLGVPMIVASFHEVPWYAFALKIVFTAVTLGTGFLGGEVTPLFFIGATLGSACAHLVHLPIELGAAAGLAAVFGAAANTPLALTVMTVELVGVHAFPHVAIVTAIAYALTPHTGIYPSQRVVRRKPFAR